MIWLRRVIIAMRSNWHWLVAFWPWRVLILATHLSPTIFPVINPVASISTSPRSFICLSSIVCQFSKWEERKQVNNLGCPRRPMEGSIMASREKWATIGRQLGEKQTVFFKQFIIISLRASATLWLDRRTNAWSGYLSLSSYHDSYHGYWRSTLAVNRMYIRFLSWYFTPFNSMPQVMQRRSSVTLMLRAIHGRVPLLGLTAGGQML